MARAQQQRARHAVWNIEPLRQRSVRPHRQRERVLFALALALGHLPKQADGRPV